MKNLLLFISMGLVLFVGACQQKASESHGHKEYEENHDSEFSAIAIPIEQVQDYGIQVDTFRQVRVSETIRCRGQVHATPFSTHKISTPIAGTLQEVRVITGQSVRKGEVLATLSHPNLVDQQSQYLKKVKRLPYLKKEYQRNLQLFKDSIGSGKALQQSKANYKAMKAQISALENQFRQLGWSPRAIRKGQFQTFLKLKARKAGQVSEIWALEGQYVQPQSPIFEVIGKSHLHGELTVYGRNLMRVASGQPVYLKPVLRAGDQVQGYVKSLMPQADPLNHSRKIHVELGDNENFVIGEGLIGNIEVSEKREWAFSETAVVEQGGQQYVYSLESKNDSAWVVAAPYPQARPQKRTLDRSTGSTATF